MGSIDINVNVMRESINSGSGRTISRIRKCLHIKRVALEKIRTFNEENRLYGFTHLYKLSRFQISNYIRYIEELKRSLEPLISAREPINAIVPLNDGFFAKRRFNWIKRNLLGDVVALSEYFELLEGIVKSLIANLNAQRGAIQVVAADSAKPRNKYFKSSMTGEEEAELIRLAEEEIRLSEELISRIENSREAALHFLSFAGQFQSRLIDFFIALSRNRIKELKASVGDSGISFESICDKIERNLSGWYAIKTILVISGYGAWLVYPDEQVSQMGFLVGSGTLGLDFIMDSISGIPAARRNIIPLKNRIAKLVKTGEGAIVSISKQLLYLRRSVVQIPDFL